MRTYILPWCVEVVEQDSKEWFCKVIDVTSGDYFTFGAKNKEMRLSDLLDLVEKNRDLNVTELMEVVHGIEAIDREDSVFFAKWGPKVLKGPVPPVSEWS